MAKAVKAKKTKTPAKAKKPAAKKKAKVAAAPAVHAASADKVGGRSNFMWRLLKKKEAEREKMAAEKKGLGYQNGGAVGSANGFSRFAGPRRRVG